AKLATLLKTFAKWPDFIARVTKEVAPSETVAVRAKHLTAAVTLFEKAMRPDLACDAQLALAEALRQQKKHKEAASGLRLAVKKFPTEGRYIPRLMAACEQVCDDYPASVKLVADLYVQLVPALAAYYKGEESKPLAQLKSQAFNFFMAKNLTKHAAKLKAMVG